MADNAHLDAFKTTEWTYTSSWTAGTWEAQQGYTPSPQQSTESAISYDTRMQGYWANQP